MASALLRLLALFALMIMPLGMTSTPAMAAPADHSMTMTMTADGHCDPQQDRDRSPVEQKMECTAACTALPASTNPVPEQTMLPATPRTTATITPFSGIDPEIATPPPKRA